ncbi:hypothetical protein BDR05DRAFT_977210 [Suillus weaverae]|nr:hypothetical protein BDR05DRAFT_977210 [Suillus weaverae]
MDDGQLNPVALTHQVRVMLFSCPYFSLSCLPVEARDHQHDFAHGLDVDFGLITLPTYSHDDIKVEHYPNSGIKTKVHAFNDFHHCPAASSVHTPPDNQPWRPFHSLLEFDVAELTLEAGFNNDQTDRLIKICHRSSVGKEKFTFRNHKDIHSKWEAASHRITKFTKKVILVPYDGKMWDFDVHYRDLRDLATDLLQDPRLFPHFTFDAQRLSKFDGQTFIRFIDEPFTAQDFWDVQPLAFILYADKTRLSLFGTAKGYPVVALLDSSSSTCLANLPMDIRNGRGIGSGYIVGWLPIVTEDKEHAGKASWVNFKNAVCHESFARITCIMSLTRGIMSLWPCPICLVPRDELWDTSKQYPRRTANTSHDIVMAVWQKDSYEELEELLKQYGLCNLINSLWAIRYSDVHRAFFAEFLRWRNLKHPNQVMSVTFADSSVHEDISKMIIYATHNILTEEDFPLGYLLLRCVRLYLEVDMYAAFEVHTANTISEGRSAVQALTAFMKQYITATDQEDDKNWSFSKLHMTTHLFDDIKAKGATRNYNMKPNEQMHRPLKDSYQNRTNFKNFAEQILCIDHWLLVADDISHQVSDFDEYVKATSQDQVNDIDNIDDNINEDGGDSESDPIIHDLIPLDGSMHVKLGSRQAPQAFSLIENAHRNDDTFTNFRVKLNSFLNVFLPASNIPLPDGKRVHLPLNHTIVECRFLRVNYKSMVDWQQHTDYLHCSPWFFNAPHFDCVFIQTKEKVILGHLLFLFECPVGKDVFPLALHLNLFRVRAKPQAQAEFFSVRSIIHGALLVHDENLDYLVVDTVDTNMFLCVKEMHLQAGHVVRI